MLLRWLLFVLLNVSGIISSIQEYKLIQDLMAEYDPNVRPVSDPKKPVYVKFGMELAQILELDEINQVLEISIWWRSEWNDAALQWDPLDYGNITTINFDTRRIWRPDIVLYSDTENNIRERKLFESSVHHTGRVRWFVPMVMKSVCPLNMTYFPWDQQVCTLMFGSWSYDGQRLVITNRSEAGQMNNYKRNGEWDVIGVPLKTHAVMYSCCEHPFYDVSFYLIIRRKMLYYFFNMILPCVVTTVVGLVGFCLPPESGEKLSLGMTVLLSLSVFLLLIAEITPTQSQVVPLLSRYFAFIIVLMACSVANAVFIVNVHHQGEYGRSVPPWLHRFVLVFLATILCRRGAVRRALSANLRDASIVLENGIKNHAGNIEITGLSFKVTKNGQPEDPLAATQMLLREIGRNVTHISRDKLAATESNTNKLHWKLVAHVLECGMMVILVIVTVAVCTWSLVSSVSYSDDPLSYIPD